MTNLLRSDSNPRDRDLLIRCHLHAGDIKLQQIQPVLTLHGSQHFKQTKFPDISQVNFQNARIIISTYFPFETIVDAIAENISCSEHGEATDTGMHCIVCTKIVVELLKTSTS